MGQIVISPSGNFYGSEQVLFEYIKTTVNESRYNTGQITADKL